MGDNVILNLTLYDVTSFLFWSIINWIFFSCFHIYNDIIIIHRNEIVYIISSYFLEIHILIWWVLFVIYYLIWYNAYCICIVHLYVYDWKIINNLIKGTLISAKHLWPTCKPIFFFKLLTLWLSFHLPSMGISFSHLFFCLFYPLFATFWLSLSLFNISLKIYFVVERLRDVIIYRKIYNIYN